LDTHQHTLDWWQLALLDVKLVLDLPSANIIGFASKMVLILKLCHCSGKHPKQH